MNNDLISREALRKAIHNSNLSGNREWLLMELDKIIDNAPPVEPRDNFDLGYVKGLEDGKPKQGKWDKRVIQTPNHRVTYFFCSECGKHEEDFSKFCPNCGADMRKGGAE